MGDFSLDDAYQPLKHASEKIPNNYQKYLSDSKMRNQKLKELNEKEMNKGKLGNREDGFSLYFNGANIDNCADMKIKLTSVAPRRSKTSNDDNVVRDERRKTAPGRRKWASPTKVGFLTDRGDRMFARPSDYYSEDFDDDAKIDKDSFENGESYEIEEEIVDEVLSDLSIDDVRNLRRSIVLRGKDTRMKMGELCTIRECNAPICDSETDVTLRDTSLSGISTNSHEGILTRNESNSDARLMQIIERVVKMNVEQQKSLLKSLGTMEKDYDNSKKIVCLSLVIESNWGHENRVGLTEVAFWSMNKEALRIQSVVVCGDQRAGTSIDNIIDGKKNTAKEKHMWSCEWPIKGSLMVNFSIEAVSVNEVRYLSVWNYNKSMDTLSVGARDVTVWHGEVMLLRGVVDKSLGNCAFNPPTVIEVPMEGARDKVHLDSSLEFSSDDECLLDKLRNAQNKTYRKKEPEVTRTKNSARYGRRSEMEDYEDRDALKDVVQQFEKETLRPRRSTSLEQSWTSLNYFNKSQAGRLSIDQAEEAPNNVEKACDIVASRESADDFVIPELPEGRVLTLSIFTTWGDPHYVGLTGIEMFSASGDRIRPRYISADPPDVNILPGYGDDPRVVANLLDGVNKTRDDVHMWLAPFTAGQSHQVRLEFAEVVQLALLRLWNYNKSRIHSLRGARDVLITLDELVIFRGEIIRAPGSQGEEDGGEVILFTNDDSILDLIGQNDDEFAAQDSEQGEQQAITAHANELLASLALRPPTAKETNNGDLNADCKSGDPRPQIFRPFTGAKGHHSTDGDAVTSVVRLDIVGTWGDKFYVGLTGVQLLDDCGNVVEVDLSRTTSTAPSGAGDIRTLDKIFDEENVTTEDEHMWLAEFSLDKEHSVSITLQRPQRVTGLRVWNYNKSPEDSYRGVRQMHLSLDGRRVSPEHGYLLRRAPGHVQYDFVQEVTIGGPSSNDSEAVDDARHLPCGFVYQLNLFSAWGDLYYVGLTGLELYDQQARRLHVAAHQVHAFPDSVNALTPRAQRTPQSTDVRTPDKLVDAVNDTFDPKHMWLAPLLPGCLNKLFVVFDRPVAVSMLRLWNYGKTPARGLKDFAVLVDDLLIYSGVLPATVSTALPRGILPHLSDLVPPSNRHRTVLFDVGNSTLLASEKAHLLQRSDEPGQDVVLTNENDAYSSAHSKAVVDVPNQKFRPTTSVARDRNRLKTKG